MERLWEQIEGRDATDLGNKPGAKGTATGARHVLKKSIGSSEGTRSAGGEKVNAGSELLQGSAGSALTEPSVSGPSAGAGEAEVYVVSEVSHGPVAASNRGDNSGNLNGDGNEKVLMRIVVVPKTTASEGASVAQDQGDVGQAQAQAQGFPSTKDSGVRVEAGGGGAGGGGGVSYPALMRHLRRSEGVRFLDVSAGGVVIGGMMREALIDEVRLTIAGQV